MSEFQQIPVETAAEYSPEQEEVFQRYREGKNIFITGPGGTGKTRIIQRIYADALERRSKIQVCAMTGCAAVLLECKAKTIHSWSGIGLGQGDNEVVVMKTMKKNGVSKRWREADILIIDEVSMMSKKIFEILNLLAKRSRRKLALPFGGLQVILSGDFFQLPPVFRPALDDPDCGMFCFESPLWNWVFEEDAQIALVKNFRQTDNIYMEILNEIREGRLSEAHMAVLKQRVGMTLDPALELTPTQIYPINAKVVDVNTLKLMELPEPSTIFEMEHVDQLELGGVNRGKLLAMGKTMQDWNQAFENLKKNCLCEPELKLKIGAQVMHIVNREVAEGKYICNGEQGTVIDFAKVRKLVASNGGRIGAVENIPAPGEGGGGEAVFLDVGDGDASEAIGGTGDEWEEVPVVRFLNGWTLKVGYHEWMSEEIDGVGIRQIPLILAWAVSIHKCQGTTLGIAEVDIGSSVFECAQSYVALSRVKTLGGLYLKSFDPRKIRADPRAVEYYRKLGETRAWVLAERERRAREQPVAVLEPRNPTLSRYFVSNQPTAPIPPNVPVIHDTENAKRGDVRDFFGSSRIINENKDVKVAIPDTENAKRGGSGLLEEEEDYTEVATEVADYMLSDVKVINFSAYAYRG
jgi:ATP-dependent DNA helicase PIF1